MPATVQLVALGCFAVLRLATPGWMLLIFLVTLIGPAVVLAPSILAAVTARRGPLEPAVTAPFVTAAVCLVVAGALVPEFDDQRSYTPLLSLFADAPATSSQVADLGTVGMIAGLGLLVTVVWAVVAVAVTSHAARSARL